MPYSLVANQVMLETKNGDFFIQFSESNIKLKTADPDSVYGWRSRAYGQKEAALSFSVSVSDETQALFWTILSPRPVTVVNQDKRNLLVDSAHLKLGQARLIEVAQS